MCLTQIAQAALNTSSKVLFFFLIVIKFMTLLRFISILFCKEMLYISSNHLQMDGKGRMCLGIPSTSFTNNLSTHLHHSSALGESPPDIKDKEGSTRVNEKQPVCRLNFYVNNQRKQKIQYPFQSKNTPFVQSKPKPKQE